MHIYIYRHLKNDKPFNPDESICRHARDIDTYIFVSISKKNYLHIGSCMCIYMCVCAWEPAPRW